MVEWESWEIRLINSVRPDLTAFADRIARLGEAGSRGYEDGFYDR